MVKNCRRWKLGKQIFWKIKTVEIGNQGGGDKSWKMEFLEKGNGNCGKSNLCKWKLWKVNIVEIKNWGKYDLWKMAMGTFIF